MSEHEHRNDGFTAVEDRYAGYTVVDRGGAKIGKVDDLFLVEDDRPEYFGVKMGFLGTSSTLIPADITTINEERGFVEVSQSKEAVKEGPPSTTTARLWEARIAVYERAPRAKLK